MSHTENSASVLRTKLYRPLVTDDFVLRKELFSKLEAGFTLPLTLVTAPAGYGKSTLVSYCLEHCSMPGAWLSLDQTDSDLRVFVRYLVEALRTLAPGCCKDTVSLVNAEAVPPLGLIAAQLGNDLEELGQRIVLVLDDYHLINNLQVHEFMDQLLAHPSPKLHLAILGRRDPPLSLASFRVSHRVNSKYSISLPATRPTRKSPSSSISRPVRSSAMRTTSSASWPSAAAAMPLPRRGGWASSKPARPLTGQMYLKMYPADTCFHQGLSGNFTFSIGIVSRIFTKGV
jgi:hypothetical protein